MNTLVDIFLQTFIVCLTILTIAFTGYVIRTLLK